MSETSVGYSHVVEGSFRAIHDPATKCVRCQRTSGETGRAHILNGGVAGWACYPECPDPGQEILGLPAIARLLGVTHPTASLYASRGKFPVEVIDGRRYARRADVEAFKQLREAQKAYDAQSAVNG